MAAAQAATQLQRASRRFPQVSPTFALHAPPTPAKPLRRRSPGRDSRAPPALSLRHLLAWPLVAWADLLAIAAAGASPLRFAPSDRACWLHHRFPNVSVLCCALLLVVAPQRIVGCSSALPFPHCAVLGTYSSNLHRSSNALRSFALDRMLVEESHSPAHALCHRADVGALS